MERHQIHDRQLQQLEWALQAIITQCSIIFQVPQTCQQLVPVPVQTVFLRTFFMVIQEIIQQLYLTGKI